MALCVRFLMGCRVGGRIMPRRDRACRRARGRQGRCAPLTRWPEAGPSLTAAARAGTGRALAARSSLDQERRCGASGSPTRCGSRGPRPRALSIARRLLAEQVREFRPEVAAVATREAARALRERVPGWNGDVRWGPRALADLAAGPAADIVLVAVVGIGGLGPTLAALDAGRDVALATKEVLVAAGPLVVAAASRTGRRVLPVDSEPSAVCQCLATRDAAEVGRLWITASGGPFLRTPRASMADVTPAQALRHPTWRMGPKVTIDSATLMNKGFELIEAHWLFGVAADRIEVVIHPQSVVHSCVELRGRHRSGAARAPGHASADSVRADLSRAPAERGGAPGPPDARRASGSRRRTRSASRASGTRGRRSRGGGRRRRRSTRRTRSAVGLFLAGRIKFWRSPR